MRIIKLSGYLQNEKRPAFWHKKGANWPKVLSKERRNKPHADKDDIICDETSNLLLESENAFLFLSKCSTKMPT